MSKAQSKGEQSEQTTAPEWFTRKDVNHANAEQMAEEVRSLAEGLAKGGERLMWNGAVHMSQTVLQDRARYIGKDDAQPYNSQTDYVTRGLGIAKGSQTMLSRIAVAVGYGFQRTSPQVKFLLQHGGAGVVGQALKGVETKSEFADALKPLIEAVAKDGKVPAVTKGADSQTADEKNETPETRPVQTVGDFTAALRALTDLLPTFSMADRRTAVDALVKAGADATHVLSLLEKKAAREARKAGEEQTA